MAFCSKCGGEIKKGDIFCGNCGTKIEDSANEHQVDDFEQGFNKQSEKIRSKPVAIIKNQARQLGYIISGMLLKPVSTMGSIINDLDKKSTLIAGVIFALIQGIFSLWKLGQLMSMLDKTVVKLVGTMQAMSGLFGGGASALSPKDIGDLTTSLDRLRSMVKIPYGIAFLHGIILYIIIAALIFIGIYVTVKLLSKDRVETLSMVKISIFAVIPAMGGELLSIILSYLSQPLGMFILLIGFLVSFTVIVKSVEEIDGINSDKLAYAVPIVLSVVILCSLFIILRFILSDINIIKNSVMQNVMNMFY